MALIKKQLLAKEDMLLSADNMPVSQARAGTTVSVHPVNASVIPFDETRSISEAIQDITYTHPLTHPVSIIDGSSNPSKFVKTDALGNTGFDGVAWADIEGKPGTYTPSAHEHSMAEVTAGNLSATRIDITADRQFITADQLTILANAESLSNKGQPLGYAPLDSQGKINPQYLGSLSIIDVFTPADLPSMLALTAQPGDIAFRLDNNNTYMLIALPASTEANWKQLSNSVGVLSVNGLSGVVSISTDDVPEGAAKYYTDEKVDDRVAALLQAGTNITLTYNDALNTLTISANDTSVNWSEIQSTPSTIAGYGITDAYVKSEVYTQAEANAVVNTHATRTDNPHSVTASQLGLANYVRADKYLAVQNIANMVYTNGDLAKIQYNAATDVNYETLGYTLGNLTTINHYIGSTLRGTTTLTYSSGSLASAVFVGV